MLLPYNTDAPLYHRPWGTLGLIGANGVAYAASLPSLFLIFHGRIWDLRSWMALQLGHGLHPLEWLTSSFVHYGLVHLIGNMIALRAFGLIIEGKIGWWRFVLLYLGIGILGDFLVQLVMLGATGGPQEAGGASLAIFGLMSVALVWAPRNELSCYWVVFYRLFECEMSILAFCGLFMGLELLSAILTGFAISSAMLHLTGAAIGFAAGALMLKHNLVDCEGWDLWSVWNGKTPGSLDDFRLMALAHDQEIAATRPVPPPRPDEQVQRLREELAQGRSDYAYYEYTRLQETCPGYQLELADLEALMRGLLQAKSWSEAAPLLQEAIDRVPHPSATLRLRLAAIDVEALSRPRHALRLLESIDPETLDERSQTQYRRIERKAHRLIDDGAIELDLRPTGPFALPS